MEEHKTFRLLESHIKLKWNCLCLYFIWKKHFFFMPIESVHHLLNFFQLMPVLFSCAVSDFLYEEFGAMPIRA